MRTPLAAIAAMLATSCAGHHTATPPPPSGDATTRYEACWAAFLAKSWQQFDACYTDGVISTTFGFPPIAGKAKVIADHQAWITAFPDATFAPQLTLVGPHDVLSVRWFRGTHTGAMRFPGGDVPATHKAVSLTLLHRAHLDDSGRTASEEWAVDIGTLMFQLGLDKAPGRAPLAAGWPGAPIVLVARDTDGERANAARVRDMYGKWNAHDMAGFYAFISDDVRESFNNSPEDTVGKPAVKAENDATAAAFSDLHVVLDDVWAAGDYTIARGHVLGTNDGKLGPTPPTHKKLDWSVLEIIRWQDGKAVASFPFVNGRDFNQQLGLQ
jgi:predicted ester cyclase